MKRSPLLPVLRSALAATALCATALAAQASVLILGAPQQAGALADVQSKIAGTGVVSGVVDVFNVATGTPTLAQLQSYSAVMVFSDAKYANAAGLGDLLADYVDAGGGVVEAGLSHATVGLRGLTGRFVSGNYDVYNSSTNQNSCGSLGAVALPDSPLMRDIDSFSGGLSAICYRITPKAGAVSVASWTNGNALLGYRTDHNGIVVGLNMNPVSGDVLSGLWDPSTDGALLMANALAFAARELPEPGSLALLGIAAVAAGVAGRRRSRAVKAAATA
ncbi:PEP-CTERM sorting domain-containing protein [Roseateles chitinivorans]|uniref:PEP-CTERM sorting domain-containing protein n=1 Tax=Roseateles chitinivorans TaxID=2917965 RepID=UPI003D672DAC